MSRVLRRTILPLVFLLPLADMASAQMTIPAGSTMAVPSGAALKLGCTDFNILGSVSVGSAQIDQTTNVNIGASGQLDGGQGTITVGGGWNNTGTFMPGTSSVIFSDNCGGAPFPLTGNTIFNNLTLISTTGRNFVIPSGAHITVNGTLTLQGAQGTPITLTASSGPTAFIALGAGANVVQSNASLANVQIGAAVAGVQTIPTLGNYGLFLLTLLLMMVAGNFARSNAVSPLRKRK